MHSVAAILLAAGQSRRMGAQNKLLLEIKGEPLVRRVARNYLKVLDGPLPMISSLSSGDSMPLTAFLTSSMAS